MPVVDGGGYRRTAYQRTAAVSADRGGSWIPTAIGLLAGGGFRAVVGRVGS